MPRVSKVQIELDKYTPIIEATAKGSKSFPLTDAHETFANRPQYWGVYENIYYRFVRLKLGNYSPSDVTIWNAFRNLGEKLYERIESDRQTNIATKPRLDAAKSNQGF